MEIIGGNAPRGARTAVARRARIGEAVSDAIERSDDSDAITALLSNPSAQIREETLDRLIERAPRFAAWHSPLVRRPRLPTGAVQRLAQFVTGNLLSVLAARADIDPALAQEIADTAGRKLAEDNVQQPADEPLKRAMIRARQLHADGKLGDAPLGDAITARDRHFVRAALAVRAKLPVAAIDRVLGAHSAKGLLSLAWKAGLEGNTATRLQADFAHIKRNEVLRMMPDGSFPMSVESMQWHLEFLTGAS